jgi:hypothetical protein
VVRMGAAVVAMEVVALVVAVLTFGWAVLLVGAPLFVGTVVALAVIRLWELVQVRVERRRAARWEQGPAMTGGLMSGFFEVSAVADQPSLPPLDMSGPVQRVLELSDRLPRRVRALGRSLQR